MSQRGELRSISSEQYALRRRRMDRDPWMFARYITGYGRTGVERIHRPMLYLFTRRAELLAATLDDPRFEGEVTDQIKKDLLAQKPPIDWRKPEHMPRLRRRLRRVNYRGPRGSGKSVFADIGNLWETSIDPNLRVGLASKSDPFIWSRMTAMGEIVKSEAYAFWYPERVPTSEDEMTKSRILLNGRTEIGFTEATIEGRGVTGQWTGHHYNIRRMDDIVGTESGQANIEDAKAYIANLEGITVRGIPPALTWKYSADLWIGTSNGEGDDMSLLLEDPTVMSVVMPIEKHDGGTTIENIYTDGVLTMEEPGWFDRETVNELKANARSGSQGHSVTWLLQNFYVTAHKQGTVVFTERMVRQAQFLWMMDEQTNRELIWRPKKGREDTCRDPKSPAFNPDDWFVLDIDLLPVTARGWAGDQALKEDGDEWALEYVVMDWQGVLYWLADSTEHGYGRMLDEIPHFDRMAGKPKWAYDANAMQGMATEWMRRNEDFRELTQRVTEIRSTGEAKDQMIRRWIQARMLAGDLYINPRLTGVITECLKYRPRTSTGAVNKRAVDNRLDAGWMACTLPERPPTPEELAEEYEYSMVAGEQRRRSSDPFTGINTDNWMQYATM